MFTPEGSKAGCKFRRWLSAGPLKIRMIKVSSISLSRLQFVFYLCIIQSHKLFYLHFKLLMLYKSNNWLLAFLPQSNIKFSDKDKIDETDRFILPPCSNWSVYIKMHFLYICWESSPLRWNTVRVILYEMKHGQCYMTSKDELEFLGDLLLDMSSSFANKWTLMPLSQYCVSVFASTAYNKTMLWLCLPN